MRTELLQLANRLSAEGEPFVLATVVRREAPTSAQLGDAAIITADGAFHGWLGGACTKDLVIREALAALGRGAPRLVALTADPDAPDREGIRVLPMTCHSGGAVDVYLDPQLPEDRLIIYGDTEVSEAVARMAPELGFRVEKGADPADSGVSDASRAAGPGAGAPDAPDAADPRRPYVVIATYGQHDEASLADAFRRDPVYVGLVSGRKRFAVLRETLIAGGGLAASDAERIRSPAGLDIGARTPAEIAISILAEMVEVRRERIAVTAGDAAAAAATGATATTPPEPEAAAGDAESDTAIDPVCGMTVPRDAKATAEFDGRTYSFCCDGCRQRFLTTPEMFSASYAGG